MNIWDILIIVLVAAAIVFAVIRVRKGKSRCCNSGCGCAGCAKRPDNK